MGLRIAIQAHLKTIDNGLAFLVLALEPGQEIDSFLKKKNLNGFCDL